ncbi:MAG: type II toxin-antitoxin system HicB family antitoxin, partial [Acidobacteriaceae bacterium]|nr:type II toxin-antitoxin system HicB family antitoxin [Acidobacteriaceae bacterium]
MGDTLEEIERMMHEAIEFHLEGMREDGLPIPEPTTS